MRFNGLPAAALGYSRRGDVLMWPGLFKFRAFRAVPTRRLKRMYPATYALSYSTATRRGRGVWKITATFETGEVLVYQSSDLELGMIRARAGVDAMRRNWYTADLASKSKHMKGSI